MTSKYFKVSNHTDKVSGLVYPELFVRCYFKKTDQLVFDSELILDTYASVENMFQNTKTKKIRHLSNYKIQVSEQEYLNYWAGPFTQDKLDGNVKNPLDYAYDYLHTVKDTTNCLFDLKNSELLDYTPV